jgi:hypothetical protein
VVEQVQLDLVLLVAVVDQVTMVVVAAVVVLVEMVLVVAAVVDQVIYIHRWFQMEIRKLVLLELQQIAPAV